MNILNETDEPVRIQMKPKDEELEGRLKAFMQDLWDHTHAHPFMRGTRITENSVIEARPFSGSIRIQSIQTLQPRSGGGTEAMNLLCALADKHNVPLTGTAKKFGTEKDYMTTAQLAKWYQRFGFTVGRGSAREGYDIRREPKGGAQ